MKTEKLTLSISGMTCAACANRIERGLSKLPGVEKSNVNFAMESATLEYDPSQIKLEGIEAKVAQLGYKASLEISDAEKKFEKQREERTLLLRFLVSALLSTPLLWSMVGHIPSLSFIWLPELILNPWFQFTLATPIQFFIGWPFYKGAYKALKNFSADMNVLVALGTSAAYFYSLYVTVRSSGISDHMSLYYETSAVLITLIILGKLFEVKAKGKTSAAIQSLIKFQAKNALVYRNNKEIMIPIEEVQEAEIIFVKPGEKIPVDGIVLEGHSSVDESMISGESMPVSKKPGDELIGSTINKNGFLKYEATRIGQNTLLAQIIKIVEEAQGSKAPIQRIADRISGIFVPVVVIIAIVTFLSWYFWFDPQHFSTALENAIAVLVIACPCALGLATPTSIMAGSGRAAEYGILFKGAEHLERTHLVDCIVFDKTGTLTEGKPVLTDIYTANAIIDGAFAKNLSEPLQKMSEDELLSLAASAEKGSEHPIAEAIVNAAQNRSIPLKGVQDFQAISGYGIQAKVNNNTIILGTPKLMTQNAIIIDESVIDKKKQLEAEGKTVLLMAIEGTFAGLIAIADTVKSNSFEAVENLKKLGIKVLMLSGDNQTTANAIASQVGITDVRAEVLPDKKSQEVKQLQSEGYTVAMVGDGINDAPALATADIGIAMGTGSDIAIETADITLLRGDLRLIADSLNISKKTMRNIKQNLFWALAYNSLGIPIAAAGLLAPWLAGAAMAFSSVSVVLNALRLQRVKLES